jgi:tetratricopeptide (TPR) repeat protein
MESIECSIKNDAIQNSSLIVSINSYKKSGNICLQKQSYKEALDLYIEGLNLIAIEKINNSSDKPNEFLEIDDSLRLNCALCNLEIGDYDQAIEDCLEVLRRSDNNKAYYRLGISYFKKGDYANALRAFYKLKSFLGDSVNE